MSAEYIEDDPNYTAFHGELEEGVFDDFEPGTWVAYLDGERVGSDTDRESLLENVGAGVFITQVGVEEKVVKIRRLWGIKRD